jgi:hypothetical protein
VKRKLKPVEVVAPLKLDLGCGKNKKPGFVGVDAITFPGVDTVHDLTKPWPWKDASVDEVHSSHFLEHLMQEERVLFFNELYRVLRFGAQANIVVPSWSSERAYGDPTHKWPPVVGFAFLYLNKAWREQNAPHTAYTCDFDFQGGNTLGHPWHLKNQEAQLFAQNHYLNVALDTFVTITKTKRG